MSTNRFRIGGAERGTIGAFSAEEKGGKKRKERKKREKKTTIPWEDSASVAGVQTPDSRFSKYTRRVFTSRLRRPPELCCAFVHGRAERRRDPSAAPRARRMQNMSTAGGSTARVTQARRGPGRERRMTDEELLFPAACSRLRRPDGMAETHPPFPQPPSPPLRRG